MRILAIETSCDETAIAIVEAEPGKNEQPVFTEVVNFINSQAELHAEFGGVFPQLAKREHSKNIIPILGNVLKDQETEIVSFSKEQIVEVENILERYPDQKDALIAFAREHKPSDIDYIVVTQGPGLAPALWVGITFARALSYLWNIPMVGVNHMEGHIVSVLAKENSLALPAVALLISGGHTQIIEVENWGHYTLLGETLDDALGEAYDKVARMLDIPYPGGPEVSKCARAVRESGVDAQFDFPRPMLHSKDYSFSFSGLKTSVLYTIQALQKELAEKNVSHNEATPQALSNEIKDQICFSFEEAITEVLLKKLAFTFDSSSAKSLIIGGGVIANQHLRTRLAKFAEERNIELHIPDLEHTTDNAVMIAIAGYFTILREEPSIAPEIIANGNMSL